jgi:hypothetical protein
MTEADIMRVIREHVDRQFPKKCRACQKVFLDYRDYLLNTQHQGNPVSWDIEMDNWKPADSSGNFALANCRCGNTLVISSSGMPLMQIWKILHWVKMESLRRGVKIEEIICYIRDTVEQKALV